MLGASEGSSMLRQALVCALLLGCSEASKTERGAGSSTGGSAGTPMVGGSAGSQVALAGAAGASFMPDTGPTPPGDTCDDVLNANQVGSVLDDGSLLVSGNNYGAHEDLGVCRPDV